MFHFALRVGHRRWHVLNDHVCEASEFPEEPRTDQTKQWTNVQFQLGLRQTNAEFIENTGQSGIDIAHHLSKARGKGFRRKITYVSENLVQRLENELNERTRGVRGWTFLPECSTRREEELYF